MSYNLVAIVPMRHNSERIAEKNFRTFAGKPLFYHIISSLLRCGQFDKVVIDTDSPVITELTAKDFPDVLVLQRPGHLLDGKIPMNDILLNVVQQVPSRFYFQTHSTNPLLTGDTISAAIAKFHAVYPVYDSLFSVTKKHIRLWDNLSRPINHNQDILLRTQDLPPVYEENSCMYIFSKEILEQKRNRIGNRPYLFEIAELEAQDIDIEINFRVAEILYQIRGEIR
jgi:CMP-N-acetylneuraminic acid synthetase